MNAILKSEHSGVASPALKPAGATIIPGIPEAPAAPAEALVGLKLRRTFASLSEVDLSAYPDGVFHLESLEPSLKWYFRRSTKPRLYVNLHGAVDRKQISVPVFARWNWAGILPGHMLCVSDPTLELSPDLRYGWYVGTERNDVSVMVADLVQQVAVNLGVKNRDVVFFGSSGGGFAALMCARHMEGATCLIMNCLMGDLAQKILLSSVFAPERTHEEVRRIYGHRFSILEGFSSADDLPVTLFAQNSLDPFKNNYDVFCEKFGVPLEGGISSNGRVMSTLFAAPGGHTHFPPQVMKSVIQKHLEFVASLPKSSGPVKAEGVAEAGLQAGTLDLPIRLSRPVPVAPPGAAETIPQPGTRKPPIQLSRPVPVAPVVPRPVIAPAPQKPAARRPGTPIVPQRPEQRSWTNERLLAILLIPALFAILLVVLVVLAVDSYFMIRLNVSPGQIYAASPSARALPSSAPIPAVVNDRPWVGTDTITTANFSNGGQPVTTLHLINSGPMPAIDLRSNIVGSLRISPAPPPDIPAKPGPLTTTGMLLPNAGANLTFFGTTRPLTHDEATSVTTGKDVLWLAGRIDYRDKAGHAHTTTFRYRYNPALGSFAAAPNGNSIN